MQYKNFLDSKNVPSVDLQLLLHLNVYFFPLWSIAIGLLLYEKFHCLGGLTKFLSLAVIVVFNSIESFRLYFGYTGNLFIRVPDLAGFCMLTLLMQIPLASFFLFNPYLQNRPTEYVLHSVLWMMLVTELAVGCYAVKFAAKYAKSLYFSRTQGLSIEKQRGNMDPSSKESEKKQHKNE